MHHHKEKGLTRSTALPQREGTDLQYCTTTESQDRTVVLHQHKEKRLTCSTALPQREERVSTRVVVVVVVTQPDRLPIMRASLQRNVSEIAITEVRAAAQLSWWLK